MSHPMTCPFERLQVILDAHTDIFQDMINNGTDEDAWWLRQYEMWGRDSGITLDELEFMLPEFSDRMGAIVMQPNGDLIEVARSLSVYAVLCYPHIALYNHVIDAIHGVLTASKIMASLATITTALNLQTLH